jgi:hypothetical protein
MMTVFSGEERCAKARADLVGGCDRGEVGRVALPACAQEDEHWQKMPAARRADRQVTDFTAGRLVEKLEIGPNERKQPRDLSQVSGQVIPCFATSPWSTAFV